MPNRMLRDWTDSMKFDGISADVERLFVRLIMKADDYGRFYADPRLIKANCYPLHDNLRPNDLNRWLDELSHRQLILRYEAGGRNLLAIVNYGQRLKISKPKFDPKPGEPKDWLPISEDIPPTSGKFREVPGTSRNFPSEVEEKRSRREEEKKASGGEGDFSKSRNTPEMIRIGKILNRRDSTKWSDDEVKAFKQIDFAEDEISLVESFYRFTERQNEPLHRRTTLITLLRHWAGEVDKARLWAKKYGHRPSSPAPQPKAAPVRFEPPATPDELAELFRQPLFRKP